MRDSRTLLMIAVLTGVMAVGCAHKQRIEGEEVPTLPQSNETIAPPPAAPEAEIPPAVPTTAATEAPTAVPTPVPTVEAAAPPPAVETETSNPSSKYLVVTGDTLWGISGMEITYKDNFLWPLIFKANRDQIKDPDLIYPKLEFSIRHDFSLEDINKAKKNASDTPKYVPHTEPRETLPVDYF